MNIRDILASNLKFLRIKKGLTQIALCENSGVSIRFYQNIEKSKTQWPMPDTLDALAKALDVDPCVLFIDVEKKVAVDCLLTDMEKLLFKYEFYKPRDRGLRND